MMIKSLYDFTKKAYYEYPKNGLLRDQWIFNFFAQPVLTVDLIKWTEGCEKAILLFAGGRSTAMLEHSEFMKELINREVAVVRG